LTPSRQKNKNDSSSDHLEAVINPPLSSDNNGDEEDMEELVNALMDEVTEIRLTAAPSHHNDQPNFALASLLLKV